MSNPKADSEPPVEDTGQPVQDDLTQGELDPTLHNTIQPTAAGQGVEFALPRGPTLEIPGYRILQRIGQGGMGTVYLAHDEKLKRQVAVKVLSHAAIASQKSIQRFLMEIETAASLKHPNIAQLYSAGEQDGVPYYVMEYVEGRTLDAQIARSPLEPRAAAELLRTLADAVEYCHRQGIVHRDLKPSNVLMSADAIPKITDFGLAKGLKEDSSATKTGEILGTPSYMAPEQASGNVRLIGPRTDVYGLGAIFYHILTGRTPFAAPNLALTISQVIADEPISLHKLQKGVPRDLDTICLKCLAKNPDRRYGSARELSLDVTRFLQEEPILARPVSSFERLVKWSRRRPAWATLLALIVISIPTAFTVQAIHTRQLREALQRETEALQEADFQLSKSQRLAEQGSQLSEWLLNDHGDQLAQVSGTTTIRNGVNQRVKQYLDDSIDDMPGTGKFVRRFGLAYYKLAMSMGADSASSLGQTSEAIDLLGQAIDLYDQALKIDPNDKFTKNLKIQALLELTSQQFSLGQLADSEVTLQQAQELFDSNSQDDSRDRRLMAVFLGFEYAERLEAAQNIPQALQKLDEVEQAIDGGTWEPLIELEAEHQRLMLARSRARLLIQDGEYESAQSMLEQALETARRSYERQPENPKLAERYVNFQMDLADVESKLGNYEQALVLNKKVLELQRLLADANSDESFAKLNLATAMSRIASTYFLLGRAEEGLHTTSLALEMHRDLQRANPGSLFYERNLIVALTAYAAALIETDNQAAEQILVEAQSLVSHLLTKRQRPLADLQLQAELYMGLGLLHFNRLLADLEDQAGLLVEHPNYIAAIDQFDLAEKTFAEMELNGDLNYQQESLRANSNQYRELVLELARQIDEPQ